jgi:FtsP/CotA-like multicopper oxidase with cupredoxin domain
MKHKTCKAALVLASLLLVTAGAQAMIDGVTSQTFSLTATTGTISTPDGNEILIWGYANGDGAAQYPGVTMMVYEDQPVTVTLSNQLTVPVSITFPGQTGVVATGDSAGLLTAEAAANGGSATYAFTPAEPGTYLYHSGTRPELQIEMGLVGALIVRPTGYDPMTSSTWRAYHENGSEYDREFLFLLTEMDPAIHKHVELGQWDQIDNTKYWPVNWYINGRCAPDTMFPAYADWLPNQPYNCMPMIYPGERMLMRVIGGGRDQHPFHHHGNHATIIAQDGRPLISSGSLTIDQGIGEFTIQSVPGGTFDSIFTWTGAGLGWDVYGHEPGDPPAPNEYLPDHGKPFPVILPEAQDLTFGGFWSGSPFLGTEDALPPGEGGMNPTSGYVYMWHSHTEKEMVNNDIFPGGMMTMLVVVPPNVAMPMPMMP